MNSILWVLQILLAAHTAMGAVWKFTNSEQTVPSLKMIPHGIWLTMSVIELACSLCLVIPALNKRLGILVPIAAGFIAAEMLLFTAVNVFSTEPNYGHVIYWLVVAAVCTFIAYGRFVLKPIGRTL